MFDYFKNKFGKTKAEHQILQDLPEVMKGKLTRHYSRVSNLDKNCELLTTFYDYLKAYDQNEIINWRWECHQRTLLDHADTPLVFNNDIESIDYFRKTFTKDCVFNVQTGFIDCKKIIEISSIDPKLVDFKFTSGSLLTPPTDSSISPDFLL
jgi:hypothetical protein